MTWTRLDDLWTGRPVHEDLSYEQRWHYLCLIQWCSKGQRYDGVVRRVDALRCSDVPDPQGAMDTLVAVGLIKEAPADNYTLLEIDDHTPPPNQRPENARPASRKSTQEWRRRKCQAGEHSKDCPRDTCPQKQTRDASRDASRTSREVRDEPREQSRQDRTEQDWTRQGSSSNAVHSDTTEQPKPAGVCESCGKGTTYSLVDGRCRRCIR